MISRDDLSFNKATNFNEVFFFVVLNTGFLNAIIQPPLLHDLHLGGTKMIGTN